MNFNQYWLNLQILQNPVFRQKNLSRPVVLRRQKKLFSQNNITKNILPTWLIAQQLHQSPVKQLFNSKNKSKN